MAAIFTDKFSKNNQNETNPNHSENANNHAFNQFITINNRKKAKISIQSYFEPFYITFYGSYSPNFAHSTHNKLPQSICYFLYGKSKHIQVINCFFNQIH